MDFSQYNDNQREAVTTDSKQVIIVAGPGSGKTRVLTGRIAYLIQEKHVDPRNILAMTFTNKAGHEMKSRVEAELNHKANLKSLTIGTFHAVCGRILRAESEHGYWKANFGNIDSGDADKLFKNIVKQVNAESPDGQEITDKEAKLQIGMAKNQCLIPENIRSDNEILYKVYSQYQTVLKQNNLMDFDDMLLNTYLLFKNFPEVCKKYAERYEYVLVDEVQDTNKVQFELIKQLVSVHHNFVLCGDLDQSIFGWRGARYENFSDFEKLYPNSKRIMLNQNYRSAPEIVDFSKEIIDQADNRESKALFSERPHEKKPQIINTENERSQAVYIVHQIQKILDKDPSYKGSDIAVLYRTNSQSAELEKQLVTNGIPYVIVRGTSFYQRLEIKDMLAYLSLISNHNDEMSLSRIINKPCRKIGPSCEKALYLAAEKNNVSAYEILTDLGTNTFSAYNSTFMNKGQRDALRSFGKLLAELEKEYKKNQRVDSLIRLIVEDTHYFDYLNTLKDETDKDSNRQENVETLVTLAGDFVNESESEDVLQSYLAEISLMSDQDSLDDRQNAVTLMTMHVSKGLEYRYVFIVAVNETNIPHYNSCDTPEDLDEERRLLYVAATRAKDKLCLSFVDEINRFGDKESVRPSRFIRDIPQQRYDFKSV